MKMFTLKDFKGIEFYEPISSEWPMFECLAAVGERVWDIEVSGEKDSIKKTNKAAERKKKRGVDSVLQFPKGEGEIRKRQKLSKKSVETEKKMNHGPNPPPELPMEFKEALQKLAQEQGGKSKTIKELNLVIQKGLYKTDVSRSHNRLSMPLKEIKSINFLTEEEIKELERYQGKNVKTIEADIIEPSLEIGKISFRRWKMKKDSGNPSISYVLTKNWNGVVSGNSLAPYDIVQVWSVRLEEKLCFIVVKLPNC